LLNLRSTGASICRIKLSRPNLRRGTVKRILKVHHTLLQGSCLLHCLRQPVSVLREKVGELLLALTSSTLQLAFFASEARCEGFDCGMELLLQLHLHVPMSLLLTPPQRLAL
jgi:hypothetical protein